MFKALKLLHSQKYVSRSTFSKELLLGEGAVKTLISHLKDVRIVDSVKAGTFLTNDGIQLIESLIKVIRKECNIKTCKIASKKFNHAIILKNYAYAIKTGIEQRDFAILYGSEGCTTIIYKNSRFVFPGDTKDCLADEPDTKKFLIDNLDPEENDVIIISSSNDPFVSEISAINSALWTLATN